MLHELLARIAPPPGLLSFFHSQYQHGMAQCLLLDRLRPDWKDVLAEEGKPLTALLAEALALDDEQRRERFDQACERFDHESLLAEQTARVNERRALLRGFLEAPGRRYRVYHGDLPGSFNWKPQGPVYHVPEDMLPEDYRVSSDGISRVVGAGVTVWEGGFEAFDKGHLRFHSRAIPIVFGPFFFQWIDPEPAKDLADLKIESDAVDGDVHRNARLVHEDFELSAGAVRVVQREDLVEIHPVR